MASFVGFVREGSSEVDFDVPAAYRAYVRRFQGEEVEVEIRKRRAKRSLDQNAALHAMLTPWCLEGHLMDDLKRDVLRAVFGTREVVNAITGELEVVLAKPHTSKLNTQEFAFLMERAVEIAAECGVILELPDEYNARKAEAAKKAGKAA
jgi:hypothetical protein